MATNIERTWTERGDGAACEDVRLGHTTPITTADVRSALLGHLDADLADLDSDDERDETLTAAVRGYVAEARRLGVVVTA